jgi:hypothetical protein
MKYGLCNLSLIPVRLEASDTSEMVTQLLYGEFFKIIESRKNWSKIRNAFDNYEGWIDTKQYIEISSEIYHELNAEELKVTTDIMEFVSDESETLISIPIGSNLNALNQMNHKHDGNFAQGKLPKEKLIETALLFINAPYLWGGKSPFGIDCSGFTQLVYKLNGYQILRDAKEQATQGETLSFIEESEPGDLAFFDNNEGIITHVGIIMSDNYIIHAHGKVRIDRMDHSGIFNLELKRHSHKLRVIKRII